MSLAVVQEQLVTITVEALAACGRPVDVSYRYQGPQPRIWPCAARGEVHVWWSRAFVSPDILGRAGLPDPGSFAKRFEDHYMRLVRCFPGLQPDGNPAPPDDVDAATASLDDDFDCVWQALQAAVCSYAWVTAGCSAIILADAKPIPPRAQTAGFEIHLIAASQA